MDRKKYIKKRNKLTPQEVKVKSEYISQKILKHIKQLKINNPTIGGYYPINNEVNILPLLETLKSDFIIALPKILNNKEMCFIEWKKELVKSRYFNNIYEPVGNVIIPNIIIVPVVIFSDNNLRIGYGGGYYDRYLEKIKSYNIAAAYDFQYEKAIVMQQHDVLMNIVITN